MKREKSFTYTAKYLNPHIVVFGEEPHISEWTKSKIEVEIKELLLKDKGGYLASWQDMLSTSVVLTEPNWSLNTKDYKQLKNTWPKREC